MHTLISLPVTKSCTPKQRCYRTIASFSCFLHTNGILRTIPKPMYSTLYPGRYQTLYHTKRDAVGIQSIPDMIAPLKKHQPKNPNGD